VRGDPVVAAKSRVARQREALQRRGARARIYLKDPHVVGRSEAALVADVPVWGDTGIADGPTSARFIVVDYDASRDVAFPPARAAVVARQKAGDAERVYEFHGAAGTAQEAQVNAWATAVDTLDLFEQPSALGREIPWAFDGGRLRILPHAMLDANAFYSRQTRALHFGYIRGAGGSIVRTSLSHDIIAHETAHAVLDGLRPLYLQATRPDAGAFHEFIGDLAAMLSLFRHREFVRRLVGSETVRGDLDAMVADLAPQLGSELYGSARRPALRSAANDLAWDDVRNDPEPHRRSQVLSGMAYDLLRSVVKLREARHARDTSNTAGQKRFASLWSGARVVVQMLVRALDLLPPADLDFVEYTRLVLQLDEREHRADARGYRRALERILAKRGLRPAAPSMALEMPRNRDLAERNVGLIRSSRVGAYRFLDANRDAFAIPRDRDFRVASLSTNQRLEEDGTISPGETIVQYLWDEHVALGTGSSSVLDRITIHGGGAIAIDDNANLVHWTRQRLDDSRRAEARAHVRGLLRDGAIDFEPSARLRSGRTVLATRDGRGNVGLWLNTARLHDERKSHDA